MKEAILSVKAIRGVLKISAGNYGGNLGEYKIYLKELI
jgi:formylmethanofuran:tetrahydromethanopterin formyltransferase